MKKIFSRPKQFGEILDLTFQLIKNNFKNLLLILLLFNGPLIIVQAIFQIYSGRGIIRDMAPGENFIEQFINTFGLNDEFINPFETSGNFFIGFLSFLIYPLAFASIYLMIKHIKNNQTFDLKQIVKQAFSHYWSLLGSYLCFIIAAIIIAVIPLTIVITTAVVSFTEGQIIIGILSVLFFFPVLLGILLLITRLAFFFPVTIEESAPGLLPSFRLTKGRTWMTFFLFFILFAVSGVIGSAFEFLVLFLGVSVVYTLMINLLGIFTSIIFFVGYSVIYFDLEVRQSGSDLKQLIDDYHPKTEPIASTGGKQNEFS